MQSLVGFCRISKGCDHKAHSTQPMLYLTYYSLLWLSTMPWKHDKLQQPFLSLQILTLTFPRLLTHLSLHLQLRIINESSYVIVDLLFFSAMLPWLPTKFWSLTDHCFLMSHYTFGKFLNFFFYFFLFVLFNNLGSEESPILLGCTIFTWKSACATT